MTVANIKKSGRIGSTYMQSHHPASLTLGTSSSNSFTVIFNDIGSDTGSRGPLLLTSVHSDKQLFIMTLCFLLLNQFLILNKDFVPNPTIIYFP